MNITQLDSFYTQQIPMVMFAGKEYGCGSSRDWAAKGPAALGVRAIIAESFERIHRSNLVGMGVAPLELPEGVSWKSLKFVGWAERREAQHSVSRQIDGG